MGVRSRDVRCIACVLRWRTLPTSQVGVAACGAAGARGCGQMCGGGAHSRSQILMDDWVAAHSQ